jgi:hypothetical protein
VRATQVGSCHEYGLQQQARPVAPVRQPAYGNSADRRLLPYRDFLALPHMLGLSDEA